MTRRAAHPPTGVGLPSEEECLDEVARLRFRASPCPACGQDAGYARQPRHRAVACRACRLKRYPCEDTPFARADPPLRLWFAAVDLAARDPGGLQRALRRRHGLGRHAAASLAHEIAALKALELDSAEPPWFPAIAAFMAERPSVPVAASGRETPWQTLRAGLAIPEFERRPLLGIGAIALLAMLGAGVGWLMVPAPPEADAELEQATAILTLGEEKPVILVTPETAAQLYDVTDVDADPTSPLASQIRVTSTPDKIDAAAATPMAAPSIKLSESAGKQVLQGNVAGLKAGGQDRPELAAYRSLAQELDVTGPRNPDELLLFGPMKIRRYLVDKIVQAAKATQVDPVLLMAIADKESAFRTEVQAQTSSATGLYQFIERTWLGVVREFGSRYGLESEARALANGEVGGSERTRILELRRDAYLSAALAAEMLKRDALRLQRRIGRPLTGGEVYLIHFLGPDGAERMLDQIARRPDAAAAELLPAPAAANKTIFYGSGADGGRSLSVSEVRGKFDTMMSVRLDRYRTVKTPTGDRSGR